MKKVNKKLLKRVKRFKKELEKNNSGNKYLKKIKGAKKNRMDVYSMLLTFEILCPARQHAIKKLLFSGLRGKGDIVQDLVEAIDAIIRAIELESSK